MLCSNKHQLTQPWYDPPPKKNQFLKFKQCLSKSIRGSCAYVFSLTVTLSEILPGCNAAVATCTSVVKGKRKCLGYTSNHNYLFWSKRLIKNRASNSFCRRYVDCGEPCHLIWVCVCVVIKGMWSNMKEIPSTPCFKSLIFHMSLCCCSSPTTLPRVVDIGNKGCLLSPLPVLQTYLPNFNFILLKEMLSVADAAKNICAQFLSHAPSAPIY